MLPPAPSLLQQHKHHLSLQGLSAIAPTQMSLNQELYPCLAQQTGNHLDPQHVCLLLWLGLSFLWLCLDQNLVRFCDSGLLCESTDPAPPAAELQVQECLLSHSDLRHQLWELLLQH